MGARWLKLSAEALVLPSPAERTGFEPVEQCYPLTGLANRRFRPLSHLSGNRKSSGPVRRRPFPMLGLIYEMIMARAAGRKQGGFPLVCLAFWSRRSFRVSFFYRGQTTLTP
jgi:hypothetical protein